jgi:hypothetical protein
MTDAPEKIWAWNTANCDGDWTIAEGQGTEYTRTDIAQARIAELEVALLATERALRVYGAKPDFYRAALRQAQAALKVKP